MKSPARQQQQHTAELTLSFGSFVRSAVYPHSLSYSALQIQRRTRMEMKIQLYTNDDFIL